MEGRKGKRKIEETERGCILFDTLNGSLRSLRSLRILGRSKVYSQSIIDFSIGCLQHARARLASIREILLLAESAAATINRCDENYAYT